MTRFVANPANIPRDAEIRRLSEIGMTRRAVAETMGISKGIVDGVVGRSKIPRRAYRYITKNAVKTARKTMRHGAGLGDIARLMGVSPLRLDVALWNHFGEDSF